MKDVFQFGNGQSIWPNQPFIQINFEQPEGMIKFCSIFHRSPSDIGLVLPENWANSTQNVTVLGQVYEALNKHNSLL